MTLLFAITLFVSAFLLFWIQPLMAKMLLPYLGGTPAVWNTCVLFFQSMLLIGYAYVSASVRWLGRRGQAMLHIVLLLLAWLFLPLTNSEIASGSAPAQGNPIVWLIATLIATLGLPFFVVSASAPLLQKWFSGLRHPAARDPYFLYAASNAGSLIALIAFPLLLEPNLKLNQQSWWWTGIYVALVTLVCGCTVTLWRSSATDADRPDQAHRDGRQTSGIAKASAASMTHEGVTLKRRLWWTALAFVPSSLVLGVTTYITTDIAAVPLLWVIPLALYLLTFVLVFALKEESQFRRATTRIMPGAALIITLVIFSGAAEPTWFLLLIHLCFFFVAATVCHGRLADDRPSTEHLAEYYLWMAVGGVLGGLFNALIAPNLFNSVIEYPLAVVLACLMLPPKRTRESENIVGDIKGDGRRDVWRDVWLAVVVGAVTAGLALLVPRFRIQFVEGIAIVLGVPLIVLNHSFTKRPVRFALGLGAVMLGSLFYDGGAGHTLHTERNFHGTLRVTRDPSGKFHRLYHGSTIHGRQFIEPSRQCEPLSYYHPTGPLGAVIESFNAQPATTNVAVIGLGTGASVAYAKSNQRWTFYEINPAVVDLARDPRFFTYLQNCAQAPVEIALGDARLQLQRAPDQHYGLIVLDAFSSDAIPVHLLTREALDLYLAKLAEGGLLALHISNRTLNLHPVVGDLAKNANLTALVFDDLKDDPIGSRDPSQWVVLARHVNDLRGLVEDARWRPLPGRLQPEVWSDDFSNIVGIFKWR